MTERARATSWSRFWFSPCAAEPAAAFRVLLGLYLVVYLGRLLPHVTVLFSDQGVYVPYLVPDYAPPPLLAHVLFLAMLAACAALTLGYRQGLACALTLGLFLYHYFLQLAVKQSSFERLIVIYLVVLGLSGSSGTWTIGSTSGTKRTTPTVWTRRVLLLQTSMLYLGSGLWKALNPNWHTGALLQATLQGIWATPIAFAIVRLDLSDAAWTAISQGVIGLELLLGLAFLWPRTRTAAVFAGTAFHLANSFVLMIPEFLVCLAPYPLFLPASWSRQAGQRLSTLASRFRRPRVRATAPAS